MKWNLKVLCEVAGAIAKNSTVKMVAGKDSDVGAEKLTGEVLKISSAIPSFLEDTTGINMRDVSTLVLFIIHLKTWIKWLNP